jgi:hypothetical protein
MQLSSLFVLRSSNRQRGIAQPDLEGASLDG